MIFGDAARALPARQHNKKARERLRYWCTVFLIQRRGGECSGSRDLVKQILLDDRVACSLENRIKLVVQSTLFVNQVARRRNVANHVVSEYATLVMVFRVVRMIR